MSDLRDLYQDMILDHSRRPRHCGELKAATHQADGVNPLCGDKVHVYLKVKDGVVEDIGFEGSGCAISVASASLMCESLKGRGQAEVQELFSRFHKLVTQEGEPEEQGLPLGKLAVFSGVREFPIRIKCATLPWHAMQAALKNEKKPVSTE